MIPAGGLVLVPEGSSSCPCAYDYKTSLALAPAQRNNDWGIYEGTPQRAQKSAAVRQLRISLGAPGDKVDHEGNVWFAFPRPATDRSGGERVTAKPVLPVNVIGTMPQRFAHNPDWASVQGTDDPWLYTCGWKGAIQLRFALSKNEETPRTYRITLHFNEPDRPSVPRVFDVRLQGETVLSGLNVLAETQRPNKALIKEFTVKANGTLTLELAPHDNDVAEPLLSAIQILEQ
jgi:hypothetical protein